MDITPAIKQKSLELGFDLVGITSAEPIYAEHAKNLCDWVDKGFFAAMGYMARNLEKRIDPAKLFENPATVICVGLIYKPDNNLKAPDNKSSRVSDYAVYNDYHDYIKSRLNRLADYIHQSASPKKIRTKVCVDTAPVAERSLAARAGLGFIGKNHMLINPDFGVEIFLGEIITDLELTTDNKFKTDCSQCTKCLDACPTGALSPDGTFDANKCVSYLTIEHKDEIPKALAAKIGNSLYGCDICVKVCPYHKTAPTIKNSRLTRRYKNTWLDPVEILKWDQQTFDEHFAQTPVERIGLDRLKRNAKICLNNTT